MFKKNKKCCSPVISYVEGIQALCEALHVVGADLLQEVDVVLRVEATHVVLRRLVGFEHLNKGLRKQQVKKMSGISRLTPSTLSRCAAMGFNTHHHLFVEPIVQHQTVSQRQAVRLHGMTST